MGKLTISMAILNSYVSHYQRVIETVKEFGRCYASLIVPALKSIRIQKLAIGSLKSGRTYCNQS